MRRERVGAIPIVDAGRLVGILTRSDVLDAFGAASPG
ncbi:MAG: CBS domain-containing protein [Deltaproteobacteria bacterium]|nr:MAG: CBS domain-containing protein [Deltaproteobacteria bacterium]